MNHTAQIVGNKGEHAEDRKVAKKMQNSFLVDEIRIKLVFQFMSLIFPQKPYVYPNLTKINMKFHLACNFSKISEKLR